MQVRNLKMTHASLGNEEALDNLEQGPEEAFYRMRNKARYLPDVQGTKIEEGYRRACSSFVH